PCHLNADRYTPVQHLRQVRHVHADLFGELLEVDAGFVNGALGCCGVLDYNFHFYSPSNTSNMSVCVVWFFIRSNDFLYYVLSSSKPIKFRSVFIQAIAVVPLPMQLSSTVSFLLVYVFIRYSKSATGFWVGWILSFLFAFDSSIIVVGYLLPSVLTTLTPFCSP